MLTNNNIKNYNYFLIDKLKDNRFSIIIFSAISFLGYLSLPHLESYHKKIQKKRETKK